MLSSTPVLTINLIKDTLDGNWSGIKPAQGGPRRGDTGVDEETLKKIGLALCNIPTEFNINPKLQRILSQKETMITSGEG